MSTIEIANAQSNGDSTPVLITRTMRNTYGQVMLGIFGTFDDATVTAKLSRDSGGTDVMSLGTEAELTEPKGITLNVPSENDLYLFITVADGSGSESVSAEVYV